MRAGIIQRETPKGIWRVGYFVCRITQCICKIIKCLIIPISILIVLLLLALEMCKDRASIEPLRVPDKFTKRGYTSHVAAQHLIANILKIQEDAGTTMERAELESDWSAPDFVLPAADVSIRATAEYLRHLFGKPFPVVTGALLATEKEGTVWLRLQVDGKEVADICEKDQQAAMDRLFEKGAREVVKATEPYILASYYHAKKERKKAEEVIRFIFRKHPGTDDEVRAINLQGILLGKEGKWGEAIEKYEEAIKIDKKFDPAYNNWGFALSKKGKYKEAIKKYEKAIEINGESARAYSNWGFALSKSDDPDDLKEAIKKYEKAARLDPTRALTYYRWGLALHSKGKYQEAIKKYEKAARLDPEKYNFLMGRVIRKMI